VARAGVLPRPAPEILLRFYRLRLDHHKLAHRSFVDELDAPRDLGKQRVVFAAAHVQSRFHPRAPLPDDYGPTRNQLPAKSLKAQPLRVRVAPVS
jgi:hypothetical protein